MNTAGTILNVIRLPRTFDENENVSVHTLLLDSGYFEAHELVSEAALCAAVREHSEYIEDWLSFSANKRTSGWYFQQTDRTHWEVGYASAGGGSIDPTQYSDAAVACAVFIKREVEDIRLEL